jgi:hypothetical protein
METSAAVTPKLAPARRTQITSYTNPQNPEITKKTKYQIDCEFRSVAPSAWDGEF